MNEEKIILGDKVRAELDIVLNMKMEEFHLLGYDRVTKDDIWECLMNRTWKDVKEKSHMYELINDVLALSVSQYMNYLSLHAYQESPESFFKQFEEDGNVKG